MSRPPLRSPGPAAEKVQQEGRLNIDVMRAIMSEEKKSDLDKVTFTSDTLRKYFPKSYTPARMQETIIKLLEQWQRRRPAAARPLRKELPMRDISARELKGHNILAVERFRDETPLDD